MASLEYGMYGYNTINPNGETSQRVICQLSQPVSTGIASGNAEWLRFQSRDRDEYEMAVPNAAGASYSLIAAPVSGLYRCKLKVNGGVGGACRVTATLYIQRNIAFDGSGNAQPLSSAPAFAIAFSQSTVSTGSTTVNIDETFFLDQGNLLSVLVGAETSTFTQSANAGGCTMSLELISTEDSPRMPAQN